MLLVPLPWSSRSWALPFLTVLAPSPRANEAAGKRHKTTIDWAVPRIKGVGRWWGQRPEVLMGDVAGCAWVCLQARFSVTLVSRRRLDAQGYDCPAPRSPGRRGRTPNKGCKKRQALKERIEEAKRRGKETFTAMRGR
jgi:hypothetical protein